MLFGHFNAKTWSTTSLEPRKPLLRHKRHEEMPSWVLFSTILKIKGSFLHGSWHVGENIPGEDWVWGEKNLCRAWKSKSHARHDSFFVSTQSSLGRARFHARHEIWLYMPGMKIGFSCPAWKSTLYGQYENWLHMLGMKTNLKIAWSLSKSWVDILSGYKVSFLFRLKRHFLLHRRI